MTSETTPDATGAATADPSPEAPPRHPAWRTAAFYAALYAAFGAHLPFWPLWLADWGLTEAEIGAYAAAGFAARILAGGIIPVIADRRQARRTTLGLVGALAAATFLAHLAIDSRALLLAATLVTVGCMSALVPVGDALSVAAARSFGFAYGRARAAGSAAFLLVNLGLGAALGSLGTDAALWTIALCLAAAAWLGWTHPGGGRVQSGPRPTMAELRRLATAPAFALFALAAGLAQASHGAFYAYASLHWRSLGVPEGTIGALWAFGVAVEVALMLTVGSRLVLWLKPSGALALAGAAGVARWGLMTLGATGPLLWALQGSHAVTFAVAHLGAMAFLGAACPVRLAGAGQAVFQVAFGGLLMAGATALAAAVYPVAGGAVWWTAAGFSAAAVVVALSARRIWDGAELPVAPRLPAAPAGASFAREPGDRP